MRAALLVLALLSVLPAAARAQAAPQKPPPACFSPPPPPHKGKHPRVHCIAGTVTTASDTGMALQPRHGHQVRVVFTDNTVFQTDSGPGSLDGIVPGDFACVTGTAHKDTFTAKLVVFDLSPFPCSARKPPPNSR